MKTSKVFGGTNEIIYSLSQWWDNIVVPILQIGKLMLK